MHTYCVETDDGLIPRVSQRRQDVWFIDVQRRLYMRTVTFTHIKIYGNFSHNACMVALLWFKHTLCNLFSVIFFKLV